MSSNEAPSCLWASHSSIQSLWNIGIRQTKELCFYDKNLEACCLYCCCCNSKNGIYGFLRKMKRTFRR